LIFSDDFAFTVMNEIPEVAAMLEIPEGYRISFVLLLGIPAVKYKRMPQRQVHSMKVLQ